MRTLARGDFVMSTGATQRVRRRDFAVLVVVVLVVEVLTIDIFRLPFVDNPLWAGLWSLFVGFVVLALYLVWTRGLRAGRL
jgi:hypothetical protein